MTLQRSVASLILCFFLYPLLAQGPDLMGDSVQPDRDRYFLIGQTAADSIDGELAIPNVFTPNGDGVNDHFEVATDGTTIYEFSIFTRSGARIFFSRSPRIFWDGRSIDGLEHPEGIYYFVIEETGKEDPELKAGFICLYR